jgi:hypothetical protein
MVAWLAVLCLCLNTLVPTVAMAIAVDGSKPVVICTPDGTKTIRLDQQGNHVPVPAAHKRHDCTICFSGGHCAAPPIAASVPLRTYIRDAVRSEDTLPRASEDVQGGEARGPPHHA